MRPKRAISIRQPWAEEILQGTKEYEYRTTACRILNERVYVYASRKVQEEERLRFEELGLKPGSLPTGVLVGTIEFECCTGVPGDYKWKIANPKRLKPCLQPTGKPQPIWFYPFEN
jgi:hypothetical protein